MALAWAASQTSSSAAGALSALLTGSAEPAVGGREGDGGGGGSGATASAASCAPAAPSPEKFEPGTVANGCAAGELPAGYVLVMTQVLPDGLGDLIFGENAVHELQQLAPVVWLRCYTSEDNYAAGEHLIAETASSLPFSASCSNQDGLQGSVGMDRLQRLWAGGRECFLAPWIFGLSTHEEPVLRVAVQCRKHFWALTEYGRGMGNIHTYTGGLGAKIPTGWTVHGEPGGVFRSICRAPKSDTDWCRLFADRCGVADVSRVRLWWFYSRKDDEKKHDFRFLDEDGRSSSDIRKVAKVVPVGSTGKIITDPAEKTNGEKLAEQFFQAAGNPDFKPTTDVSCAEATAGCAGQLSQFIWGILFDEAYTRGDPRGRAGDEVVDIIVAPNIFTNWREADGGTHATAEMVQLDLLRGATCKEEALAKGRRLFVCSAKVPRAGMRSFLEQTQKVVFTTGDQSLAEAMFMDKIPVIKPDAKVQQWQLALMAKATGGLDAVPDLGEVMRSLVEDPIAQEKARRESKALSDELELQMIAKLGGPPSTWSPTHHVLSRAGMLG
mmetsp:Transcript_90912/g.245654  ORF Transcript_90912/g.245654 Transcript_90912/m.245654 type:complete len:553 (+) Transcript_90912:71-1729(+)